VQEDEIPTGIELFADDDRHGQIVGRRSFFAIVSAALLGFFVGTAAPASAQKLHGKSDAKGMKTAHAVKVNGRTDKKGKKTSYM
jgi:hypothetical protein